MDELLGSLLALDTAEWMGEFAFRLPMSVALEIVGFPRDDWALVKGWCDHGVALLSGINTDAELIEHGRESGQLVKYVTAKLKRAKANPQPNITGSLVAAIQRGTLSDAEGDVPLLVELG